MIFTPDQMARVDRFRKDGERVVTRQFLYMCNSGERKCSPKLAIFLAGFLGIPKEKIRPDIWA